MRRDYQVSRVKGFKPVLPHTMDPTNLYIKGLPTNADERLGDPHNLLVVIPLKQALNT